MWSLPKHWNFYDQGLKKEVLLLGGGFVKSQSRWENSVQRQVVGSWFEHIRMPGRMPCFLFMSLMALRQESTWALQVGRNNDSICLLTFSGQIMWSWFILRGCVQVSIEWGLKLILAPINCRDFKLTITVIFRSFLVFIYLFVCTRSI